MAGKDEEKQETPDTPLQAHFVNYDPDRPLFEQVCICQYLSDLNAFFGIGENIGAEADQHK